MKQFWIAKWRTLNGTPKELVFTSLVDDGIARIAFQLQCMDRNLPCPNEYILEKFTGDNELRFPLTTPLQPALLERAELESGLR